MITFQPIQTVAPTEMPVTLDEAKAHCRVDFGDDDGYLSGLIAAATSYVDGYRGILGRALITQTWRQDFPGFLTRMDLPLAPVSSVATVKYYDATNTLQTLSSSVYAFLTDHRGPYVARLRNQNWPFTYDRDDPVQITFVAGYGDATTVDAGIKQAMLFLINHWYENRAPVALEVRVADIPFTADMLFSPFRRVGI